MDKKEIWKTIPGYIGIQVSNIGRIKKNTKKNDNRIIEVFPKDTDGYYKCSIQKLDGTWTSSYVHRLVALAFIPNNENKPCVNHKNSNRIDNTMDNLEWVTHKENVLHSYISGRRKQCKIVPRNTILTDYQVSQIDTLRNYYTLNQLSKLFNISYTSIKNIVIKKKKHERLDNQQPSIYTSVYK